MHSTNALSTPTEPNVAMLSTVAGISTSRPAMSVTVRVAASCVAAGSSPPVDSCDGDEHPARPVHASAADSAMAAAGANQLRFLPISSFFMIPPFFPGSCYRSPCATIADGASEGAVRAAEENPASSSKGMHVFIDSAPTDVWPTCTGVS